MSEELPSKEWVKVPTALTMFEVGKTTLYAWIKTHRVKSTCVRHKGNIRGTRLIYAPSVRAMLEASAAAEAAPAVPKPSRQKRS